MNRKEYDELSEYIKNVYSDTTNVYNMINSDYEIVDMIINDRLYIIKNNNITLRVKIGTRISFLLIMFIQSQCLIC